jgi:AcrR family transcriptional regulator
MTRHEAPDAARRRFFEAALRVCAEKGYHAARMDDIAAAAGRSKGMLYHHFSSKKELFVELCHDFVDSFTGDVAAGMDTATSVRALFETIVDGFVDVMTKSAVFSVFLEIMPQAMRDPDLRVPLRRYYQQAIDALAQLLAWGQQRGELRPDFDPKQMARVLAMAGDGLFLVGTALDEADTAMPDLRVMYRAVFDGLATQPP